MQTTTDPIQYLHYFRMPAKVMECLQGLGVTMVSKTWCSLNDVGVSGSQQREHDNWKFSAQSKSGTAS